MSLGVYESKMLKTRRLLDSQTHRLFHDRSTVDAG